MNLRNASNESLLADIKKLCQEERRITTEILHHLKEIDSRRLHLTMGYSSIYEYTIRELGYSEGSAYRRVSAMRLIRSVPEVEDKIKNGSITLDGAAKIQKFINHQRKENAFNSQTKLDSFSKPQYETKAQKLDLIESFENKSSKEIEKAIVKIDPSIMKTENIRQVSEEKVELKLIIDEDLKRELDHLKNLLSHQNPNMTYQELIKYLADMGIQKLDPSKKATPQQIKQIKNVITKTSIDMLRTQREASSVRRNVALKKSRYIPATIKNEVYMRDRGCCTYTDPLSKRRCSSKHLLQYDHVYPYSLGGETSVKNLRLLCFQHHQLVTEDAQRVGL